MTSLADEFPAMQARCRALKSAFEQIGEAGQFGATSVEAVLVRADKAVATQNVVAMLKSFHEMKMWAPEEMGELTADRAKPIGWRLPDARAEEHS